jgi:hypothetical protein
METSDDESAEDKTYKMSPMPGSENSAEEDVESNSSEERREGEAEEEEGMVEGTLNPQSRRRDPLTLVSPSMSCTSPCGTLSQTTREKGLPGR